MQDILSSPITWIVIAAASEIIGMSKYKDNSIIQLVLRSILKLKPTVKK
jgi:flagellar biosynthesis/type III secretory pathway protein FliH